MYILQSSIFNLGTFGNHLKANSIVELLSKLRVAILMRIDLGSSSC